MGDVRFSTAGLVPPGWTLLICLLVTLVALLSLGWAYRGAWRILAGGIGQDFRALAANMRGLAWGLIGFWIGYNVLAAVLPHLIVIGLRSTDRFEFGWDPLDLDIVFFIVGIVILAISRTLERAWMAEDENKHFL